MHVSVRVFCAWFCLWLCVFVGVPTYTVLFVVVCVCVYLPCTQYMYIYVCVYLYMYIQQRFNKYILVEQQHSNEYSPPPHTQH
jgi:hypothetical protein